MHLNKNKFTRGNVLLTGATGFVGTFILHKLLQTQVSLLLYNLYFFHLIVFITYFMF